MKAFISLFIGVFAATVLGIGASLAATASAAPTRTDTGGGVTVKATLPHPETQDETRFQVGLDTHSVNLDAYDLKTLSLLRNNTGKTYEPTRVENKGSGHHREITIVFPKLDPGVKRVELIIKDVAGVKERSFSWDL